MCDVKQIIVCDDEPHVLEGLRYLLRAPDRQVIAAPRARIVLEHTRTRVPQLIITDVTMPEMSGLELVAELRKQPSTKEVPIIIVTARGQPREMEVAREMWDARLITKPFDPRVVKQLVAELLGEAPCASGSI